MLLVAGLLAIAAPFFAGIAAGVFVGWLILFADVAHLVYAWSERGGGVILWQLLIGLVYVIAALYMLVLPIAGVVAFTLVLAFHIVLEGPSSSSFSPSFDGCVEQSGFSSMVSCRCCRLASFSFIGRQARCGRGVVQWHPRMTLPIGGH